MGATWILLRGLTRERGHWGPFLTHLAQALPDVRLWTPDLPGTGERRHEGSPWHVGEIAAAVRDEVRPALLRAGVQPPWYLLGLSLGGMVAAHWATTWPDEVVGCVLVNTSISGRGGGASGGGSTWHQRLQPRQVPRLLASLIDGDPRRAERRLLEVVSNDAHARAQAWTGWTQIRQERPVAWSTALRQLVAAARFGPVDAAPPVPVLIVASEADRLVDPACSRDLARRWQAPLLLHTSAGHDLPLDDPAWLARQLALWRPGIEPLDAVAVTSL